ncbi:MAG: hypothetical protein HYY41_01185 [Chloroflexi bacterium]|nr:hypothetical protein [Chloroflexota bacterium]MBI2979439.1 hypothetical protein [Chloroflexota bacterium]
MEWIGLPVGIWLVFGIILLPVYGMLLGWFLGKPRNFSLALRGVTYLIAMIVLLWGGLFAVSMLIRFVFFQP